jgi:hypothetical protein
MPNARRFCKTHSVLANGFYKSRGVLQCKVSTTFEKLIFLRDLLKLCGQAADIFASYIARREMVVVHVDIWFTCCVISSWDVLSALEAHVASIVG